MVGYQRREDWQGVAIIYNPAWEESEDAEGRRMTQTITFQFRGISYTADCEYDEGEPMHYDHLSIKPDGDDRDFLYFFQISPEWPEIDRAIDQEWNDLVGIREACGHDDVMDAVHSRIEDELIYQ